MKKPFNLGLLVGRFQGLHSGHEMMINKALDLCETTGIFIGSSQESGTSKNPFDYELRVKLLKAVYGEKVQVFPLPDLGVGNNCKWGDYVLENAVRSFGRMPDLLVSGKESRRTDWFDDKYGVYELIVPKTECISATRFREALLNDETDFCRSVTNPALHKLLPELKQAVILSQNNDFSMSI